MYLDLGERNELQMYEVYWSFPLWHDSLRDLRMRSLKEERLFSALRMASRKSGNTIAGKVSRHEEYSWTKVQEKKYSSYKKDRVQKKKALEHNRTSVRYLCLYRFLSLCF